MRINISLIVKLVVQLTVTPLGAAFNGISIMLRGSQGKKGKKDNIQGGSIHSKLFKYTESPNHTLLNRINY